MRNLTQFSFGFYVKNLFKALFIAFALYSVIVFLVAPRVIASLVEPFNLMSRMIEINKQKIIMQSFLAETELHRPFLVEKYSFGEDEIYTYSQDKQPLTDNERKMGKILKLGQEYTPISFHDESVYLLYHSYETPKYLSVSYIQNFSPKVFEAGVDRNRCQLIRICSLYASKEDLSDRVLISSFYRDAITGALTVTITSPVYDNGETDTPIGDLMADFHVQAYFPNDFSFISEREGALITNIIYDKTSLFPNLYYSQSLYADNNTQFTLRLSYAAIFLENIWLMLLLFIVLFITLYKWQEVKSKKQELSHSQDEVITDELTGLNNRKIFHSESFQNTIHHTHGCVLAIDGNKIKTINDQYGHAMGDLAIQHIANAMKNTFRSTDYLIRMGGDEFVVILPECQWDRGWALTKKLKKRISQQKMGSQNISLSVSVGIALFQKGESIQNAIMEADKNLYKEKANHSEI